MRKLHSRPREGDSLNELLQFFKQFSTTLHPAAAGQRDNFRRPEFCPRGNRHFFNPASQFSTTVNGAGADEFAPEGAAIRNRLPSEETSQTSTPGGTFNKALNCSHSALG